MCWILQKQKENYIKKKHSKYILSLCIFDHKHTYTQNTTDKNAKHVTRSVFLFAIEELSKKK